MQFGLVDEVMPVTGVDQPIAKPGAWPASLVRKHLRHAGVQLQLAGLNHFPRGTRVAGKRR